MPRESTLAALPSGRATAAAAADPASAKLAGVGKLLDPSPLRGGGLHHPSRASAASSRSASAAWCGVVGAGLFDRLGLGLLDERRVVEPLGEAVALLERGLERLGEAGLFGGDVDHAFERDDEQVARRPTTCIAAPAGAGSCRMAEKRARRSIAAALPLDDRARRGATARRGRLRAWRPARCRARSWRRARAGQRDQPFDFGLGRRVDARASGSRPLAPRSARTAARPARATAPR